MYTDGSAVGFTAKSKSLRPTVLFAITQPPVAVATQAIAGFERKWN